MTWYWWVALAVVVLAGAAVGATLAARRRAMARADRRILSQDRSQPHVAGVGLLGADDADGAALPDYDPLGSDRLEQLRAGRSTAVTDRPRHDPVPQDRASQLADPAGAKPARVLPPEPVTGRDEELARILDGRLGEPVQDESVGVLAHQVLISDSADLDGDRADDAVGEAREQWWEPTDEGDDVDDALHGR